MTAPMALAVLSACGGGTGGDEQIGADAESTRAHALAVVSGSGVYVDSTSGKDSNAGTQSKPIKTLAKLATFQLTAGQNIYLSCSGLWRETLALTPTMLADGATVTGYGSSCGTSKPRILGANDYSSRWTKTGNVWSKSVGTTVPKISRLFVNGQMMRVAQWPNATDNNGTSLTDATSPLSATSTILTAADAAALTGKNLVGAKLLVKTQPWNIDAVTVSTYTAATRALTVAGGVAYPLGPNDNYTLQDQQWMVDAPGEFYHDTAKGIVYLYPPDTATQSNLNTAKVEGSIRDNAITLSGRSRVNLRNLSAEMARDNGVYLLNALAATLTGIDAINNTNRGIHIDVQVAQDPLTRSVTIESSKVSGSAVVGIDALHAPQANISSNSVANIGTVAHPGNSLAAIQAGSHSIVNGNSVSESAYLGIRFSGKGGSAITNNRISNFCLRLEDCAAIYTWNGPKNQINTIDQTSLVSGNIIDGAMIGSLAAANSSGWLIAGVYLDDYSQGSTVSQNIINRTPIGVVIHNGSFNRVSDNKIWQTTRAGVWANMDQTDADYLKSNVVSGNEIAPLAVSLNQWPSPPKVGTSQGIWYWHSYAGDASLSAQANEFTGNRITTLTEQTGREVRLRTSAGDRYIDSREWQKSNPTDLTFVTSTGMSPFEMNLGAELVLQGGFDGGLGGWTRWINPIAVGGYASFVPSGVGCETGCAEFQSSSPSDVLTTPGLNFTAGRQYVLRLTANFPMGGSLGVPFIARKASPYDSFVAASSYNPIQVAKQAQPGETLNFLATFGATSADPAVVNIKLGTEGKPALIDNVSVRELLGYTNRPVDAIAISISAPINSTKVVNCSDIGLAEGCTAKSFDGTPQTFPTSLVAGESKLFVKQ